MRPPDAILGSKLVTSVLCHHRVRAELVGHTGERCVSLHVNARYHVVAGSGEERLVVFAEIGVANFDLADPIA